MRPIYSQGSGSLLRPQQRRPTRRLHHPDGELAAVGEGVEPHGHDRLDEAGREPDARAIESLGHHFHHLLSRYELAVLLAGMTSIARWHKPSRSCAGASVLPLNEITGG